MSKSMTMFMTVLFVAFLAAALTVAWFFGGLGVAQFTYLASLVLGWTAWTVAIAIVYSGIEKLFPRVLCAPVLADDASGTAAAKPEDIAA